MEVSRVPVVTRDRALDNQGRLLVMNSLLHPRIRLLVQEGTLLKIPCNSNDVLPEILDRVLVHHLVLVI